MSGYISRAVGLVAILAMTRAGFCDNGYALTTLASFTSSNDSPGGTFIRDSAGSFYGTSLFGGTFGLGTVYKSDAASNFAISTVASLDGPLPNTSLKLRPFGVSMDEAGNLYGSETFGGSAGKGSIFKVDATPAHNVSTLLSFPSSVNLSPSGILRSPGGNMYVVAQNTVYQMTGANGYVPEAAFTVPAGTALSGLANGSGDLYGWLTDSSHAAVRFDASNSYAPITIGASISGITGNPTSAVLDSAGNIYALAPSGLNSYLAFKLDASNNYAQTNLGNIIALRGDFPGSLNPAGLTVDGAGNLFGITQFGGSAGSGTVFELVAADNYNLSRLINFSGTNGSAPVTNLILDDSGNIYGQTSGGGAFNHGTIFKLAPAPEPSTLMILALGTGLLARRKLERELR